MRFQWQEQLTIRIATIKDLAHIFDIADAAFNPSPWPKSVFEHELNSPRSRYFVTVGGFVGVTQILDEVEIGNVAVHPDYQQQGIAQALLKKVLTMPDVTRFLLEVDATNTAAIALYRKLGFEVYHHRKKYYRNGHDALMMAKNV